MAKRKMTPEEWEYAEARLQSLRERERRIRAEIEAERARSERGRRSLRDRLFHRARRGRGS